MFVRSHIAWKKAGAGERTATRASLALHAMTRIKSLFAIRLPTIRIA